MPHPDSLSSPQFLSQIATKGALNFRGEAIALFHLPSESSPYKNKNFLIKRAKKFQAGKWEE
jgi:hypothetical protein